MKKEPGFELRQVGQENIIVATGLKNIDFSNIISMNKSAVLLWNEIGDKDFDFNKLADKLVEHYHIDKQTAIQDAEDIIQQWLDAKIISE